MLRISRVIRGIIVFFIICFLSFFLGIVHTACLGFSCFSDMTMVPTENLSKQHHLPHGGGGGFDCGKSYTEGLGLMSSVHGYDYQNEAYLGSDLVAATSMAKDESRTNSDNNNQEQEEQDKGWLRLSIGGQTQATGTCDEYDHNNKHGRGGSTLTEPGLLLGGGSQSQQARPLDPIFRLPPRPTVNNSFSTLFFQQHQQGSSSMIPCIPNHGESNRTFKPIAPSSSSSSLAPYFGRPFQVQSMDVDGPSSEVRIIDPPRRPHSGIWFILQASHNQAKEPFLPQIPKSYLRIKDGNMTVRLIMKYMANKLRLDSESEIEIRCRGQQLGPLLTLQHVRDQIWSSTPPDINNVMVLHYGRL